MIAWRLKPKRRTTQVMLGPFDEGFAVLGEHAGHVAFSLPGELVVRLRLLDGEGHGVHVPPQHDRPVLAGPVRLRRLAIGELELLRPQQLRLLLLLLPRVHETVAHASHHVYPSKNAQLVTEKAQN